MRTASVDHLIMNSEVKMLPAGEVQKASGTVLEMPHNGQKNGKNGFTDVCEKCKYVVNLEL